MAWNRMGLMVIVANLLWAAGSQIVLADEPPTVSMAVGQPITIAAADKILRAKIKGVPSTVTVSKAKLKPLSTRAVGCTGTSSQPVEIVALAAALKCNVDLIYEYVYNNIEYEPLFGSNKGALGTLLDQRGNDIDQAQLMAALLSAAGYSSSQMNFYYGYIRVTGSTAPGWLGVKNDGNAIGQLLANGGIPINTSQWFLNADGTLDYIDIAHVWLQVQIGSTNYVFDPSFKQHNVKSTLSNLATVLGYTQSAFLADAGGTIDSVSISAINRAQLRADLTAYSANLVSYIKAQNPAWTVNDIVGGKTIVPLTGSPIRQTTLPYISPVQPTGVADWGAAVPNAYRTCFAISMPTYGTNTCATATSSTIVLYADQTYGHRITIFSTPSGSNFIPTLLLDGAPPPNGQNTAPATASGATWPVYVSITHPYASSALATIANQAGTMSISAGGSYLLGAGWGEVGRGMIEKHRTLLAQYRASGLADSSEAVLGETLAVISYSWLAENASALRLSDGIGAGTTQYHHGVGITAQTAIQGASGTQGPYVDLPLNFETIEPQTYYSSSCFAPTDLAIFFNGSGLSSSLESAVLEQTQALVPGMQAASTVRLVDNNAAAGARTFFADGTTTGGLATYFSSIRPNLTASYSTADLSNIDLSVSTTGLSTGAPTGKQVLIPANGSNVVGHWTGAGYTISQISCPTGGPDTASVTQRITGGLSGGFSGTDVPTTADPNLPALAPNTEDLTTPPSAATTVPDSALALPAAADNPTIAEPVDGIAGAYLYQHSDLVTGGGAFPYALSFGRNYSSASYLSDQGLGNGWTSSFSIAASRTSDPYIGLGDRATSATAPTSNSLAASGESSAIAAAQAIAATYVVQDLMNSTSLDAQKTTLAWMTERWLTDQLTNNAVMVEWPTSSEEFTWLPHADGSASFSYSPPPGLAVALTGTVPDAYGNPTTFTYVNKDRSQLAFTAIGSAGNGQVGSWTLPSGMSVNFAYGYNYNNLNYLTLATNTLGRSLTLAYGAGHVSSVTDDTGRSVSFSYASTNDLASASDPLGAATTFAYDRSGTYDSSGHLTQIIYPADPGSPFVTNWYDGLGRVSQQANANGASTQFYFAGARTETLDPAGDRHVTYQTARGKVLMDASVLSSTFGNVFNDTAQSNGVINVSTAVYDGQDRLVLTTAPEKGTTAYTYSPDLLQNIVKIVQTQKPGSPLIPLTTIYAYDPTYNKPTRITDPLNLVSTFSYDATTGNLLQATSDVGGSGHFNAASRFTYNGVGQVLTALDPVGAVTLSTYDAKGNRTAVTRDYGRLNVTSRFIYDALGNAVAATDPNGNVTTSTFDADRRLLAVTLPFAGSGPGPLVTAYAYDANGQLLSTQQTSGGALLASSRTAYTLTGNAATSTDAKGNITRYAYDVADRLATVTDPVGNVTTYGYDSLSRKISTSNLAIQASPLIQQTYEPDGPVATVVIARSNTVADTTTYAYDGFDRLSSTTYPDASAEALTYDADSNVLTRRTRRGDTITLTYDTLNRLSTKAAPSEATVTYAYDLDSHLTGVSDTSAAIVAPAASAAYALTATYNALNQPVSLSWSPAAAQTTPVSSSSVTLTHGYDADNRRISQAANDNTWLGYPAASASTTAYTANNLNQYTAVGGVTPAYDGDGDLTCDGGFTYAYDAESRLTGVSSLATLGNCASTPTAVASYAYDAQGRRKSKTVGSTTTVYVTDADNREVLEYDGSTGALQTWNTFGAGADDALNQMNLAAGTRTTLIPDIQGSIIGSLSSGGALTKVGYQPFGGSSGPTTASNGFFYTGRRLDPETVGSTVQPSGLYYYRARTYSPTWGRFLQADPTGYTAGPNLYTYALNSPLNLTDPLGLATLQIGFAGSLNLSPLPFLSGPIGFGIAIDTQGHFGFYSYAGLTPSIGASGDVGISVQISNAKTISDLSGLFYNTSAHGGAGAGGSTDIFTGNSPNGPVAGGGFTLGLAEGASASTGVTDTALYAPFGDGSTAVNSNTVTITANPAAPGTGTVSNGTAGLLTGSTVSDPIFNSSSANSPPSSDAESNQSK